MVWDNKKHCNKSSRGWEKGRTRTSHPLKSFESIAYQGQLDARLWSNFHYIHTTSTRNFVKQAAV